METKKHLLTDLLGIKYPLIVAPMFLISNVEMTIEALKSGCAGAIPALNYRSAEELKMAIREVRSKQSGPIGINLIVNKSNVRLKKDLKICLEEGVDFYITSLGNPKEVIEKAHAKGKLVFCDVVNSEYAKKVEDLGADAIIAVNNSAGGHAGKLTMLELMSELKEAVKIPIISAGGIAIGSDLKAALDAGAAGVSVGTVFIASEEAPVTQDYKQALVDYGEEDIVMTTKLSGTPCTVINTPYVKDMGVDPNWIERMIKRHKGLKKLLKTMLFIQGMKKLRNSAFGFTYKEVWCAGPSIEKVKSIRPISEIVSDLVSEIH